MAVPGTRMRLTVVVESLAEENAHGEYRDEALKVFKERKFAMPVQLHDTFETVWSDIEQRYKTNYLNAQQAATFSIKKLQDAYECDLDMTDTVGAIFEGEPDRRMHLVRVIPHFIYRETSVVPGSMLRPSGAQKRPGDDLHLDEDAADDTDRSQAAHKRRRVESQEQQHHDRHQRPGTLDARDPSPNRPIPSTESQHAAAAGACGAADAQIAASAQDSDSQHRSARSKSGVSLVELSRTETGQTPFTAAAIKQESPEPEQSPAPSPAPNGTESAKQPVDPASDKPPQNERSEADDDMAEHVQTASEAQLSASPNLGSQEAAVHRSPVSSVEVEPASMPATRKRRDVYQVPSSPNFMHGKATPVRLPKTYGRSPRSATVIQREVDFLNMARRLPRISKEEDTHRTQTSMSTLNKARAFQRPESDEIESTPQEEARSAPRERGHAANHEDEARDKDKDNQYDDDDDDDDDDADLTAFFLDEAAKDRANGTQTPARKTLVKPAKPGSLKKPSRTSVVSTPTSARRGAQPPTAGTPASRVPAMKPTAKTKPSIPASAKPPKGKKVLSQETTSRMEHLQKLLNASQNTPKCRGDSSSPASSGSIQSRGRSNRSSPEVRIPAANKTKLVVPSPKVCNTRPVTQKTTAQQAPIKSPVPLPLSVKTSTPISLKTSKRTTDVSSIGGADVFKKPAVGIRQSPVPLPTVKKLSNFPTTGTPRRSDVPLPASVRTLRRSSSLQSSPLASGNAATHENAVVAPAKTSANLNKTTSNADAESNGASVTESAEQTLTEKPTDGPIVISSAEPSSTDYSDSENERQRDTSRRGTDGTAEAASVSDTHQTFTKADGTTTPQGDIVADVTNGEEVEEANEKKVSVSPTDTQSVLPQTQDKPPSGQGSSQAAPWAAETWDFGSLGQTHDSSYKPEHQIVAPEVSTSDDEGFAEQEIYSTAIEDNASKSRSASAAVSTRSSPAVSRRPARFLSHSPTPDASESEEESDEASIAPSRAASPQANDKDQNESESSSDSSEDENVEMPDLPATSTIITNAKSAPSSSPPFHGVPKSTPVVPEASQPTPSQNNHPSRRALDPLPTQQSSQAPRSSQSVSIQAAERRRYTGFRSLREQLADTKAAQAATQTKKFVPRTMNLGKLVKQKPLLGLEANNNESSDDDSSSSSSSDNSE